MQTKRLKGVVYKKEAIDEDMIEIIDKAEEILENKLEEFTNKSYIEVNNIPEKFFHREVIPKIESKELLYMIDKDDSQFEYKRTKNKTEINRYIIIPFYKTQLGKLYSRIEWKYISPLRYNNISVTSVLDNEFHINAYKQGKYGPYRNQEVINKTGFILIDLKYRLFNIFHDLTEYNSPIYSSKDITNMEIEDIIEELIKNIAPYAGKEFIRNELIHFDKEEHDNEKEVLHDLIYNNVKTMKFSYRRGREYPSQYFTNHNIKEFYDKGPDKGIKVITFDGRRGIINYTKIIDKILNRSLF